MKMVRPLLFVAVIGCLLTGCARKSNVDPAVGRAIAAAQKLQACPPYEGKAVWDNGIRFMVAGEPVNDLSNAGVQSVFNAKGIAITPADFDKVCAFMSQVANTATEFKGKSIELTDILSQMKKTQ